jgi:hypothetical protein
VLHGDKSACRFVYFPFSTEELFGRKGVVPLPSPRAVCFTHDGRAAWSAGPLYAPGKGRPHILLLRTAVRNKLGVEAGSAVRVDVALPRRGAAPAKADPPPARAAGVKRKRV